ncbi:uncharacterized protein LOC119277673 [Triticum dicoccoides]|nr:uncharacterized protein LOC119277673 [Triticum dicoccoides]XP_037414863.1 uncharacterized protein LOC119277673 [Triticum dicoccoides]XP_037414864.1 uncharacterized protein LOC119277673 [Triticum dicoccoides]XP_044350995.1 uncharacterized protein LOC123071486 [Triticum aestivum]VAH82021.1 unnamed protein product [Triticum turgidum subsp. durum]
MSDLDWALKMDSSRGEDTMPREVTKGRRRGVHMATARDGCAASLPYEMIMEVLQWLPIKSVFRFRAVCRSWAALLSSDEFRRLHMAAAKAARRPAPPAKLMYISPTATFDSTTVYSCSFSRSSSSGRPRDRGDLLFTIEGARGNCVEVVTPAPCHGLTLLYDALDTAYYICNAATRAATRLPPSAVRGSKSTAGLGFDAHTDEHKVVRLINGLVHERDLKLVRCEVYTTGGRFGDCWRPAAGGVPSNLREFARAAVSNACTNKLSPVFANGCLHWLMNPSYFITTPSVAIMSFSVAEETFACIRSPPFWVPGAPPASWLASSGEQLMEMDEQLCLVRNRIPHGSNTLEIWKLLDYSSDDWLLNHRIHLSGHLARDLRQSQILRVIGSFRSYRSPRKKIIITTSMHKIFNKYQKMVHTYDPRSEALETILSITETHSIPEYACPSSRFGFIQETLAPVHRTDEALSSDLAKVTREILLRLPAKSAIQYKFVCKKWFRLIESENFIRSYFQHKNMDKRPKFMLVVKSTGQLSFSFAPLNKCLQEAPSHSTLLDTKVVCSKPCHGLNLVSTETKDYLCNPCTGFHRVYRNLGPNLHLPSRMPKAEEHAFTVGNKNVGLTFSPSTRQHVIVEIFYHRKDFKSRQYDMTCALYWCNSWSAAQQISVPPLPVNDMPPAYVEGMLYWMSEPRLGQCCEWAIVSFNLAKRTFDVVPCPSWFARWNSRNSCRAFVVELEGVLCAVLADPVADILDVWKLEHGQWGRAYTINLEACPGYSLKTSIVVPLAVGPDHGRILLNTGRKIGLYDPVEQTILNLHSLDQVQLASSPLLDMPSTSSGNSLTCSKEELAAEMNRMDSEIIPFVPMLYEESLACYSSVRKAKMLW